MDEQEPLSLRALVSVMGGLFGLALIFFFLPTVGLVLLGLALAAVPILWFRMRRTPPPRGAESGAGSMVLGDGGRADASRDYERRRSA
jgi:hypothetical protein